MPYSDAAALAAFDHDMLRDAEDYWNNVLSEEDEEEEDDEDGE